MTREMRRRHASKFITILALVAVVGCATPEEEMRPFVYVMIESCNDMVTAARGVLKGTTPPEAGWLEYLEASDRFSEANRAIVFSDADYFAVIDADARAEVLTAEDGYDYEVNLGGALENIAAGYNGKYVTLASEYVGVLRSGCNDLAAS